MTVSGDKGIVEKRAIELEQRLKDLERQLSDQQSQAKKDLDIALRSAATHELEYAKQLSSFAHVLEGMRTCFLALCLSLRSLLLTPHIFFFELLKDRVLPLPPRVRRVMICQSITL